MNLFVLFVFDTTETFAYCYLGEKLSYEVSCSFDASVMKILKFFLSLSLSVFLFRVLV